MQVLCCQIDKEPRKVVLPSSSVCSTAASDICDRAKELVAEDLEAVLAAQPWRSPAAWYVARYIQHICLIANRKIE